MSEKQCGKCKNKKPLSAFHVDSKGKDGRQSYCKRCKSVSDSARYDKSRGKYAIYYLPKERYIGMTLNVSKRMREHATKGKDVSGYKVIMSLRNKKYAHVVETFLHILGYKGFRY